jgi:hypothetical protein
MKEARRRMTITEFSPSKVLSLYPYNNHQNLESNVDSNVEETFENIQPLVGFEVLGAVAINILKESLEGKLCYCNTKSVIIC